MPSTGCISLPSQTTPFHTGLMITLCLTIESYEELLMGEAALSEDCEWCMRMMALTVTSQCAQVVMFHQYPEELLRGWLRKQNIRDEQVEFCVLPPASNK